METDVHRRVLSALFALAVANAVLLLALLGDPTGWSGPRGIGYLLISLGFALGFGGLVLVRHRAPRVVLVIAVLTVCAYYIAGLPSIGVVLPLLVFLAAATTAGHRWFALSAALALFAVAGYFRVRDGAPVEAILGYELLSNLVLAGLAITLAEVIRTRRELQQSQAQALALAAEAARSSAEGAQLAERAQIARALHDELGHSLAVISLHSNAALDRLSSTDPVTVNVNHVRVAAAAALGQLRRAVRVLAGERADPKTDPGLDDLPQLVEGLRAGGIGVTVDDRHGSLPTGLDVTVFRVVREATTNAMRHSTPRLIRISVVGEDGGPLRVEIRNDGVPTTDPRVPAGRGLADLAEQVAALGGWLESASTGTGEFVVRATFPVPEGGRT